MCLAVLRISSRQRARLDHVSFIGLPGPLLKFFRSYQASFYLSNHCLALARPYLRTKCVARFDTNYPLQEEEDTRNRHYIADGATAVADTTPVVLQPAVSEEVVEVVVAGPASVVGESPSQEPTESGNTGP